MRSATREILGTMWASLSIKINLVFRVTVEGEGTGSMSSSNETVEEEEQEEDEGIRKAKPLFFLYVGELGSTVVAWEGGVSISTAKKHDKGN